MSVTRNKYWRSRKGVHFEKLALEYLLTQGLHLLTTNYRCVMGEIDLVMRHDDSLVFIEVRYRAGNDYGGALATITGAKQHKIRNAARHFLLCQKQYQNLACRFDVVGVETGKSGETLITWVSNAFY